jgi:hypothetical protein
MAEKPTFIVFVNNTEFNTSEHRLTGAQIKSLAGVPTDYEGPPILGPAKE